MLHEAFRYKLTRFAGGAQDCVRRRAVLSLENNPNCKVQKQNVHVHVFVACS